MSGNKLMSERHAKMTQERAEEMLERCRRELRIKRLLSDVLNSGRSEEEERRLFARFHRELKIKSFKHGVRRVALAAACFVLTAAVWIILSFYFNEFSERFAHEDKKSFRPAGSSVRESKKESCAFERIGLDNVPPNFSLCENIKMEILRCDSPAEFVTIKSAFSDYCACKVKASNLFTRIKNDSGVEEYKLLNFYACRKGLWNFPAGDKFAVIFLAGEKRITKLR